MFTSMQKSAIILKEVSEEENSNGKQELKVDFVSMNETPRTNNKSLPNITLISVLTA